MELKGWCTSPIRRNPWGRESIQWNWKLPLGTHALPAWFPPVESIQWNWKGYITLYCLSNSSSFSNPFNGIESFNICVWCYFSEQLVNPFNGIESHSSPLSLKPCDELWIHSMELKGGGVEDVTRIWTPCESIQWNWKTESKRIRIYTVPWPESIQWNWKTSV